MNWLIAPAAVVGVILLLVAGWVLYLAPVARLHRALALLLAVRGLLAVLAWIDSQLLSLPDRLSTYLIIAIPFAAANVAYLYWRRGTPGQYRRGERFVVRTFILVLLVVFEVAYMLDHSLYLDADLNDGPFTLFFPAFLASFALVGFAAAVAWRRTGAPVMRQGHFVVALAFLVEPAYETGLRLLTWTSALSTVGILQVADLSIRVVMGALVFAGLAMFASPMRRAHLSGFYIGPEERTAAFLLGSALVTGLGVYVGFQTLPIPMAAALLWIMNAFWLLAMALGLSYAIVRYRVLESRRMMSFAIRQSSFAAVLGVVFVVASETLEVLIDAPDQTVAIGVAIALAAGFRLLHRMTGVLVQRLVPMTRHDGPAGVNRHEVYETALEGILVDGSVTDKERAVLRALADRLDLDAEEARRLEEEVLVRFAATG